METKKIIRLVLIGAFAAAAVCVIVGLCYYIPAVNLQPLKSDPDYDVLIQSKAAGMRLGLLISIVGCACMIIDFFAYLAIIIIQKLSIKDK